MIYSLLDIDAYLRKGGMMAELTIPIQVDSIKQLEGFLTTRCIYYRVEFETVPIMEAKSDLTAGGALLAAWGSWAAVTGPGLSVNDRGVFESSDSIQRTLKSLENREGIFLDLGHFWVPNELFECQDDKEKTRIGDIYRITEALFRECYRFAAEMISQKEWMESCRSLKRHIRPSPEETAAFRQWRQEQINRARERYHHPDYESRRLLKKRGKV